MDQANGDHDLQLVDLLDSAIDGMRLGEEIDSEDWSRRHPEFGERGQQLIDTLRDLCLAAEDWRAAAHSIGKHQAAPQHVAPSAATEVATVITAFDESVPAARPARLAPARPERFGRYEIEAWVGSGAMGDVYRARDPQLHRVVAVKVPQMDRHPERQQEFVNRFLREARTAAAVRHTYVCPIYDVGEQEGTPYVVMAFVEGEPLSERLKREGRYEDPREAVTLALQVAEALQEVHQHGIIHRDLKPGNVLLERSDKPLLTDFGLARSVIDEERMTVDGGLLGTPAYMPPEQALGDMRILGPAVDLYSLGVVLFELLTGKLPFSGGITSVIVSKATRATPASPAAFRPDLDPGLVAIVDRAIRNDPAERFPSAAALATALRDWLKSTDHSAAKLQSAPSAAPMPLMKTEPARQARKWPRRSAVMAGAGLVTILGIWVATLIRGGTPADDSGNAETRVRPESGVSTVPGPQPRNRPLTNDLLAGELKLRFIDAPAAGSGKSFARRPKEGDAVALINGQAVQLRAQLNQPGHVYIVWIDCDGVSDPIYPWDFRHSKSGWDAPFMAGSENAATDIRCPPEINKGFTAAGKPGIYHVVLLARKTPLKSPQELRAAFSGLPASPPVDGAEIARYVDWSSLGVIRSGLMRSGLVAGEAQEVGIVEDLDSTSDFDAAELPLWSILQSNLQRFEFDLIKVWRFALKD